MNLPIWRGGKLTTAATLRPTSLSGVVPRNLRARFLHAYAGTEIDLQFERGLARLREGRSRQDGSQPYIDSEKLLEGNLRRRRLVVADEMHGAYIVPDLAVGDDPRSCARRPLPRRPCARP